LVGSRARDFTGQVVCYGPEDVWIARVAIVQ
jgi:hypothetical protein